MAKWLIVGLGNPGKQYENTPHNLGFEVVELLARRSGVDFQEARKFQSVMTQVMLGPHKVHLMKPLTYMNLSGQAARPAAEYFEIPVENVVAICDDINLPFGKLRVRAKGSHGGQNGLRNMIDQFGSDAFARVRLGCQPNHPVGNLADYVLGKMGKEKRELADLVVQKAADCIQALVEHGIEKTMAEYNGWSGV
ncbi:MAG: aminoacyl-tRNA hydrolase [Candidatus Sumerlaeia bacterium]|nr:aminoacyl-tRNA hydrolase [Candidatus Sumerlaeia bacterium]